MEDFGIKKKNKEKIVENKNERKEETKKIKTKKEVRK